jgi:hypothetical protein
MRILARTRIRVSYRCRLDGIPHDPARHGTAAALAEQPTTHIAA